MTGATGACPIAGMFYFQPGGQQRVTQHFAGFDLKRQAIRAGIRVRQYSHFGHISILSICLPDSAFWIEASMRRPAKVSVMALRASVFCRKDSRLLVSPMIRISANS